MEPISLAEALSAWARVKLSFLPAHPDKPEVMKIAVLPHLCLGSLLKSLSLSLNIGATQNLRISHIFNFYYSQLKIFYNFYFLYLWRISCVNPAFHLSLLFSTLLISIHTLPNLVSHVNYCFLHIYIHIYTHISVNTTCWIHLVLIIYMHLRLTPWGWIINQEENPDSFSFMLLLIACISSSRCKTLWDSPIFWHIF